VSQQGTGAPSDPVIARVAGRTITERELRDPLVATYGLNMLLNLARAELADREAERAQVHPTDADIAAERLRTVDGMFQQANAVQLDKIEQARATDPAAADAMLAELRKDNEAALDQLLTERRASRPEFEAVIRTNATLRKIVEPQVSGAITEERLTESFRVQYGEKVLVRHIQANNLTDLNAARRRLADGEAFEKVAAELSTNRVTGPLGGEVIPFTRSNTAFPQSFRDAAFALKVGEVSEVVQADGAYHVLKLEQRIDPTAVRFEDVKESVRADLHDRLLQAAVRNLRQQIEQEALAGLQVSDPILKQQFDERVRQQQAQVRDREAIRTDLNRQRETTLAEQEAERAALAAAAATQPATAPATTLATTTDTGTPAPTTAPASAPAAEPVAPAPPVTVPVPAPATQPVTAPVAATQPRGSFVDDLFPATMPKPMRSSLPGSDAPAAPATAPEVAPAPIVP
jgi:parvulin-like peptidyl-prolyl isomerase